MDVLLIHPPALKAAEPPLGVAILLQQLRRVGLRAEVLDANLGAYLYLLEGDRLRIAAGEAPATGVRRALRHGQRSIDFLRTPAAGRSFARYSTAVGHLEEALALWGEEGERLTLGDYRNPQLSEFAPADLDRLAAGETATLFAHYFREEVVPRVEALRPRLVGLSVNYRHQILPAFELAGMLRRRFPDLLLVGGGGIFSGWRPLLERGVRFSPFDRLVVGPGEGALTALAGGDPPFGYLLADAGTVGFLPDFSFAAGAGYLSPLPTLPFAASRGCYWRRCGFCPEAASPVHPYAALPPEELPELLRRLAGDYGAEQIHFTDDALPPAILRQLASLPDGGPGWHGFARLASPLTEDGFVERLANSGCRMLQLGLESGSQAVLDRLQKGVRLTDAAAILPALKRAGIATYVYILLGTPGEKAADAEATLDFLERHGETIDFLNLAVMNLPREAGEGELPEGEELGFYRGFQAEPGWDRREVRRFLRQRLLASPAVRAAVNRVPPAFTSNHAFLFSG